MSRIDTYRHATGIPAKLGPHPDYQENLKRAEVFCETAKKSLLKGMDVKISDGTNISKATIMVSYTPPRETPLGNYATPISLHQPSSSLAKQIEGVFSAYMRTVAEIQKKPEFLPPDSKV